jgi:hypothetical protein
MEQMIAHGSAGSIVFPRLPVGRQSGPFTLRCESGLKFRNESATRLQHGPVIDGQCHDIALM